MHHYSTSHPSGYIQHSQLTHSYDSPNSFLLRSSSYTDHEVGALSGPSMSSDATGFTPSATGYQYPPSVWPTQPTMQYAAPLSNAPLNPHTLKSWSPAPTNPAFFRSVPPGGMAILPPYHSASRILRSNALPAATPPLQPVTPVHSQQLQEHPALDGNFADVPEHSESETYLPANAFSAPSPAIDEQSADNNHHKKHHCWMCHKSFDRPSTLRKHLLVHTGERAFKCDLCGRRFSVASNLSRHEKRCVLQKHHTGPSPTAGSPSSDESSPPSTTSVDMTNPTEAANSPSFAVSPSGLNDHPTDGAESVVIPSSTPSQGTGRGSRKRLSITSSSASDSPNVTPLQMQTQPAETNTVPPDTDTTSSSQQPKPKRRRRAPSPSNWIPDSLKQFDLSPLPKATPVPLPPVQPYHDPRTHVWEERDSFDREMATRPYHPDGWKGRLPGPGVVSLGGDGLGMGKVGGTLLVF